MLTEITKFTKYEIEKELDKLGYKVSKSPMTFNYYNDFNKVYYKAKSCDIIEKDTKMSFANIEARRDSNFKELQNLRYWADVVHNDRVWEL